MTGQASLFEASASAPPFVIEYLAGFAARYAFGDAPVKAQRQQAHDIAERYANELQAIKDAA